VPSYSYQDRLKTQQLQKQLFHSKQKASKLATWPSFSEKCQCFNSE